MVEFVAPTAAHIDELAANLRQQDIDELRALGHDDLRKPIGDGVALSTWCYTALADGHVLAIFGVAPMGGLLDPRGVPWALGTDRIWPNRRALARASHGYIRRMLATYPHLTNIVHARNTAAVGWLQRVGFKLHDAQPVAPHGEMFHVFEKRR